MSFRLAIISLAIVFCVGSTWAQKTNDTVAKGQTYYVDSNAGSDAAPGTAPEKPWKSITRVNRQKLQPGDAVRFRRGQSWSGTTLAPASDGTADRPITFAAYGKGALPELVGRGQLYGISCSKSHITIENLAVRDAQRFNILILAPAARIIGCQVTGADGAGIKFEKKEATGAVINCQATENGTGLGCGNGAGPIEVQGGVFSNNRRPKGAGDGIQVDSTAADVKGYRFTEVTCSANAISGINFKSGTGELRRGKLIGNRGTGLIVQNRARTLAMSETLLEGNNAGENGVFQVAIESGAHLVSQRNTYKNLVASKKYAGGIGIGFDDPVKPGLGFTSENDIFMQVKGGEKLLYHVGLSKNATKATISIKHAVFHDVNQDGQTILDLRNGKQIDLTLVNIIFHAGRCHVRYPGELKPRRIDGNCYFHPGNGPVVEIGNRVYRGDANGLAALRAQAGTDKVSIAVNPDFAALDGKYRLSKQSLARDAGVVTDVIRDRDGKPFGNKPNMGIWSGSR